MTGPGQPRTCSHPINARTLTGVLVFYKTAVGLRVNIAET